MNKKVSNKTAFSRSMQMIVFLTLRASMVVIFTCIAVIDAHGNDSPEINAYAAATNLFYFITKPVPNMKIVATIEKRETPWSEQRIREVISGAHFEEQFQGHPNRQQLIEQVIATNVNELRRLHSGTSIVHVCEWLGPKLYRKDILCADGSIRNKFKGVTNVIYTWVNIGDQEFSEYLSWRADPISEAAVVSKDEVAYDVENLWEASVIEPESAFGFMLLVKTGNDMISPAHIWPKRSLFPLRARLSENRLRNLLRGDHPEFALTVRRGKHENVDCVILSIESKTQSGTGVYYYMDYAQKNLLKVVRRAETEKLEITTIRRGHDANGVPREWTTVGRTSKGPIYRRVLIHEVTINPSWDLEEVFSPNFPENYSVSDATAGKVKNIQSPVGKIRPYVPVGNGSNGFSRKQTVMLLMLLVNFAVVYIVVYRRMKARANTSKESI